MLVYRLANRKYSTDLTGTGAALAGGRWNTKGRAVVYSSESIALSLLEVIVNLPPMMQPLMNLMTLEIPDQFIFNLPEDQLPPNWFKYPYPNSLAKIAEKYYQDEKILALKVPSAIIHSNFNFLINPNSRNIDNLKLLATEPFVFDPRVYRQAT
ncbi:RES family NAD+ phosphorylase [Belliella marina]|uniref:RES family NAD+ phosphorylase n=1 Tax=Belliella marina TaxID=1644146 RepID=A0ABW4VRJ9_9BACT